MSGALIDLLTLCLVAPPIVLWHELGHAAFAKLGGFRVTSFGVGLGRPLWRARLRGGVIFHVDRWVFAGGACTAIPVSAPSKRRAWFHAGGLIFQLALGLLFLLLPQTHWVALAAQFNLLVALTNAAPWRLGGHASDGWYLLDLLSNRQRSTSMLGQREIFARQAAIDAELGAPLGLAYARLCVAWADLLMGETKTARALFHDDPPAVALDGWVDALWHYVQSEWHRQEGRPLAAVHSARQGHASLPHSRTEEAQALLSLAEARALVDSPAPERAERVLGKVVGLSGALGLQATAVSLHASLGAEPDALEHATWRVARHARSAWLDPFDAVSALLAAADALRSHGRIAAADGAKEAAHALARSTSQRVPLHLRAQLVARLSDLTGDSARSAVL